MVSHSFPTIAHHNHRSTQCGHTFCETCLLNWLQNIYDRHVAEHPAFLAGFQPPPHLVQPAAQRTSFEGPYHPAGEIRDMNILQARSILSTLRNQWHRETPVPEYTCPKCRHRLTKRPVYVLAVKDVVSKVAKLMGEDEPEEAKGVHAGTRDGRGNWNKFFPDK